MKYITYIAVVQLAYDTVVPHCTTSYSNISRSMFCGCYNCCCCCCVWVCLALKQHISIDQSTATNHTTVTSYFRNRTHVDSTNQLEPHAVTALSVTQYRFFNGFQAQFQPAFSSSTTSARDAGYSDSTMSASISRCVCLNDMSAMSTSTASMASVSALYSHTSCLK
jgi:hypothetical protein